MQNQALLKSKSLKAKLQSFSFPSSLFSEKTKQILANWKSKIEASEIEKIKEKELQGQFLNDFFKEILGFKLVSNVSSGEEFNLIQETTSETSEGFADATLGFYNSKEDQKGKTQVVIELKGAGVSLDKKQNRANNESPVDQALKYIHQFDRCKFAIVSNFKEIRLYSAQRSKEYFEVFTIRDLLDENELKRFYFALSRENLISKVGLSIIFDQISLQEAEEKEITKKFYKDFKDIRLNLFRHILENNSFESSGLETDQTTYEKSLLSKSQKILDRIVFIAFCEDSTGLLPRNILKETYEIGKKSRERNDEKIWREFKNLFIDIDVGREDIDPKINAYNGGLFAKDEILENLKIKDEIWENVLKLCEYDFSSDLNVNILGHIFEQSISDIENIKEEIDQKILQQVQDDNIKPEIKKTSKRKKDGIFYTPEYITKYIVENTVGKFLDENPERIKDIKILDPACGSGAFLNQAHSFLQEKYKEFYEDGKIKSKDASLGGLFDYNPAEVDKSILLNNLYGVDLNEESVEIAKLSLWLKTAKKDQKLDNLDKNIKCGNSLIDDENIVGNKAFKWEKEFEEIMQSGGFDVIIGNPPYIKEYTNKSAFDGLHNNPYYEGKMDLWTLFACQAIDKLKIDGYLAFIAPNNWISNAGASIFRDKILNDGEIISFIDFGDFKVFEDAGIQTMIFVFKKCIPKQKYFVSYVKIQDKGIKETYLEMLLSGLNLKNNGILSFNAEIDREKSKNQNLIFANGSINLILKKIDLKREFILEEKEVGQGIVGAPDECFLADNIIKFTNEEKQYLKPFFTSSNRYKLATSKSFIFYISAKNFFANDLNNYPNIKSHFDQYERVLTEAKKRYGTPEKPFYFLHRERDERFFEQGEKVVCASRTLKPSFFYTDDEYYGSRALNFIKTDRINLKYLTAILNSNVVYFWLRYKGKLLGDLLQIDKAPLLQIPIPKTSPEDQKPFIEKADLMLSLNKKLFETSEKFFGLIKKEFRIEKPTTRLAKWYHLEWADLLAELKKFKVELSGKLKEEWFERFERLGKECLEIEQEIERTDKEIDRMVYGLYGLAEEEIKIMEGK